MGAGWCGAENFLSTQAGSTLTPEHMGARNLRIPFTPHLHGGTTFALNGAARATGNKNQA